MATSHYNLTPEQLAQARALGVLRQLFVKTDRTQRLRQSLRLWHEVGLAAPEGRSFVLSGESGTGKSAILRAFSEDVDESPNGKSVYVEVPANCTTKKLAQAILKATGDPCANKGVLASLEERLTERLSALGYTVLILDEAQHLVKSDNLKVLSDVADWLKQCLNKWNMPIVLAGIERIEVLFDVDDQIYRREGGHKKIKSYIWSNQKDRKDLKLVLRKIASLLPFNEVTEIHQGDIAHQLFVGCGGNLGRLTKLIEVAAQQDILNGSRHLTVDALADAFEECRRQRDADRENPFLGGSLLNA